MSLDDDKDPNQTDPLLPISAQDLDVEQASIESFAALEQRPFGGARATPPPPAHKGGRPSMEATKNPSRMDMLLEARSGRDLGREGQSNISFETNTKPGADTPTRGHHRKKSRHKKSNKVKNNAMMMNEILDTINISDKLDKPGDEGVFEGGFFAADQYSTADGFNAAAAVFADDPFGDSSDHSTSSSSLSTYGSMTSGGFTTSAHGHAPVARRMSRGRRFLNKIKKKMRKWNRNCWSPAKIGQFIVSVLWSSFFLWVGIPCLVAALIIHSPAIGNPSVSFLPEASVAWFLLFVTRQSLTLDIARICQWLVVDLFFSDARNGAVKLSGLHVTFFAIQSKEWPFILSAWAMLDLVLLFGNNNLIRVHWMKGLPYFDQTTSGAWILGSADCRQFFIAPWLVQVWLQQQKEWCFPFVLDGDSISISNPD
jgi:hypothetical protein